MRQTFAITLKSREILLQFLDNYSLEQLNKIPAPFNNNLIWNIAHIVVVQQMLVYNLSGLPMLVSPEMIAKYKRGTKPDGNLTQAEVEEIRTLLLDTVKKTEIDYENGLFKNYQSFTTMTGFEINSVEDAINFNNYHEGVHSGVMMSIRKFV
ncbi:MAG: DinB family protein [Flavobacterium sp.]|nr:MAG: DinB family protein [Flavobacterium sp.]